MKTLLYANRAEPKSMSVISILLLAAVGAITKLRCMHRECYIFASQNLWYYYINLSEHFDVLKYKYIKLILIQKTEILIYIIKVFVSCCWT